MATPTRRPGRERRRDGRRHEHGSARRARRSSQLYVGFEGSKVERPVKLLRAFAKVALAPGETKTVPLSVAVKDLAWYDARAKAWQIEPMTYGVLVGPSSRAGTC